MTARGADWHVIASFDATNADLSSQPEGTAEYTYSTREIPVSAMAEDSAERNIVFGNQLTFSWTGANSNAQYKIKAAFLSDSADRIMRVEVNGLVFEKKLSLPKWKMLTREWTLPAGSMTNGELTVTLSRIGGPNAVLSRLEILSDVSQTLFPPPPLSEVVSKMDVPMPRLSPRPVAVDGVRTPLVSLNGQWRFNPAPPPNFEYFGAAQTKDWKNIQVPGEWVMQGFTVKSNSAAAYWREFKIPPDWMSQRIKLRFDTVHSDCLVFVNGRKVGAHEGCFTAFEVDITDAVRPGINTLALAVKSESVADTLASASQYAAHQLDGITRKVQLFALPPVNFDGQIVQTTFDRQYKNATLNLKLSVTNELPAKISHALSIRATLLDGAQTVATATQDVPSGAGSIEVSIPVAAPKKWDSEHPNLYLVKTELLAGDKVTERILQRVGFRQIEIRGNQLFINGHLVKLRGVCRHEVDPVRGRSLTMADWRKDVELFREANVNYIRTSHYPPAEEFLDLCDQYGIFVECEAPLCWVEHGANSIWQKWNYQNKKFFPYLMRANYENLVANRNHPCVIIWSLANESRWSPLFAEVNRRMKLADPTRPTSFQDQCWGNYNNAHSQADIAVYHYPGESDPARWGSLGRPVLFDEYCHVECYNRRELATDPGVRDEWGRGFARMSDLMYLHQGCLGGAIWAGIDDVFCLPNGKFVGYGMWGAICDGWRRKKPEFWHVKMAYSPVRVAAKELPLPAPGQPIRVPVENRYNFANLSEVGIKWDIDGVGGKAHAEVPARHSGEIVIQPQSAPKDGDMLHLVFTDPRGFVCNEVKIVLGKSKQTGVDTETATGGRLEISEAAGKIRVSGSNASYVIDRKTGQFISATVRGKTILTGGPALMILPLQTEACEPVDLGVWKPLNNVCEHWQAESVSATNANNGTVEVFVKGSCKEAAGSYSIRLDNAGQIQVRYHFASRVKENPRQWGMVFFAPKIFNTLNWKRHAQWTVYPANHIGRPVGTATAKVALGAKPYPTRRPDHDWSQDATELGGNDFSSTKRSILNASLSGSAGTISVASDGHQSVRAFVEHGWTGLLVAGFDTGGGDGFFAGHFAAERRPLHAGAAISDDILLQLSSGSQQHDYALPK